MRKELARTTAILYVAAMVMMMIMLLMACIFFMVLGAVFAVISFQITCYAFTGEWYRFGKEEKTVEFELLNEGEKN